MTKSFLFLIGLAVVLGVGLGGAFIGGVAFGKGQGGATANVLSAAAFGPGGSPAAGFAGRNQSGGGFQQGAAGGAPGAQSSTQADPTSPGLPGTQGGGAGGVGRGGLMGTVQSIDGDTVTIDTSQGPVQVKLGEGTTITRAAEATVSDLQVGAQIRVTGEQVAGDGLTATSVTIIPEGSTGFSGRGSFGGRGSQQGQPGP